MTTLMGRQFTVIVDKSGSMSTADMPGGKTRWDTMKENCLALCRKCEQLDPDGITLYLFSGSFKKFDNVTSQQINTIFQENDPSGGTALDLVLNAAFDDWYKRKQAGQVPEGETIIVVTDGEPNDRIAVMRAIIEVSRKMDADEELAVLFVQAGFDANASKFLKAMDDELQGAGAKFDVVDVATPDDFEGMTLQEILLKAIVD